MPITLTCRCGRSYSVKDELAGRQVRCRCGEVSTVPAPAGQWFDELMQDERPSRPLRRLCPHCGEPMPAEHAACVRCQPREDGESHPRGMSPAARRHLTSLRRGGVRLLAGMGALWYFGLAIVSFVLPVWIDAEAISFTFNPDGTQVSDWVIGAILQIGVLMLAKAFPDRFGCSMLLVTGVFPALMARVFWLSLGPGVDCFNEALYG